MIEVKDLVARRGTTTILNGLSFEIAKGTVAAVVGPSGGGKTTLLRCMHGLDPFESGVVRIADRELKAGKPDRRALEAVRAKAGFVFQAFHLFAHLTVLENVIEAPLNVRKKKRGEAIEEAEALLDRVGLHKRKDALPRQLSGGESQRAAIARALAMQPEVLFMDEPTSALDPQRIVSLCELLAGLRDEGLTLVTVTHDTGFAARLADRALVLAGGELVEDGPPSKVLEDPTDHRTRTFLGLDPITK